MYTKHVNRNLQFNERKREDAIVKITMATFVRENTIKNERGVRKTKRKLTTTKME